LRVIPVLDLKGGVAVHAVRGERRRYRPVESVLSASPDPVALARAFRSRLGLAELYVADLDAITEGRSPHPVLAALAAEARVMVDAGVSDPEDARRLLAWGVSAVVIGSETLAAANAIEALGGTGGGRLVFSLDTREGAVISPDAALAATAPLDVLARLARAGWRETIVLDLARVGAGTGPDLALLDAARGRCPGLDLLVGGGVRDPDDLRALRELGVAGALIGTALHQGRIGPDDVA
jgi:phosphoribosylformimino-5-aminoimidazole carboxamide ribotide isomerase